MNKSIPFIDCTRKTRKRYKHFKPYWDDELENLWQNVRISERKFLRFRGDKNTQNQLRSQFKLAQDTFDRRIRSAERRYKRSLAFDIDSASTDNPREFWNHIKQLGPKRKSSIPLEVYDDNGNIISDEEFVFNKWTNEFGKLYNFNENSVEFDNEFYENILREKSFLESNMLDPLFEGNRVLNVTITLSEVKRVVNKSKNGKSVGIDKIPYEVLKFPIIIDVLHALFNLCFDTGLVPSLWRKAMISPLPKDNTKDKRVPLNYRGISLLSVVSKLYSAVLNNRLLSYLEDNEKFAEEQNGFRPKRSCEDHVYSACTIIKNRLLKKQDTFGTFIDLQKAFDFVNRDVLLYKMLSNNIDGKFYNSIKAILSNTSSAIKLNGMLSDWFPTLSGVRQGDSSSPTIFAFFINDLVEGLNTLNKGIYIDGTHVCCLLYADDILLLSENETDMQKMLDFLFEWCRKWRLKVNYTKSQSIHFRNRGKQRSNYEFKIGNQIVEYTDVYRYLGVHLHEHLDFSCTAEILSQAGGRALGAVISKIQNHKSVGYKTYSKLYYSCVVPVLDYCSSVWGFKTFNKIDMIQNRAIRYFLGVHKFTPILSLNGDMGWIITKHRRWVNMIRLWNRIVKMNNSRLTRKIFDYDYRSNGNTWCSEIKQILCEVNLSAHYDTKTAADLKEVEDILFSKYKEEWSNNIKTVSKLRTYIKFKSDYNTEKYLLANLTKVERSHLAQFRCGILPLRVETGRFVGLNQNDRLCQICHNNEVEDESHFLLKCSAYQDIRDNLLYRAIATNQIFPTLSDSEKLVYLINNHFIQVSKFIVSGMIRRKSILYN
jgi:hypothetical protein